MTNRLRYPYTKPGDPKGEARGVCCCQAPARGKTARCDSDDKQGGTLISWFLPHTADRHNGWSGTYGRVPWDGFFKTTITDPEPHGKQGQVTLMMIMMIRVMIMTIMMMFPRFSTRTRTGW